MAAAFADYNPIANPEVWDSVQVGILACPGIASVGEVKRKNTWDVKKGKGTLGATITFVGRDPAEFSVTFYLWTEDHFRAWDSFIKQFQFDPTKTAVSAINIFHPSLASLDIKSVVVESIGSLKKEGKGMYSIEVAFLEYFPPPKKPATGTPAGSTNGSTNKPPGTPTDPIADAQQKEIAALLKQANP